MLPTIGPVSTHSLAADDLQAAGALSRTYELRHRGQSYRLGVSQIAPDRYRVTVDGQSLELTAHRLGPHERRLELLGRTHRTLTSRQGDDLLVEIDGVPHRVSRDDAGLVRAPGSALVVSIPVSEGQVVDAGDVVAVVEAMKMESSLTAPFRGRVKQVLVGENVHVAAQTPLVALEAIEQPAQAPPRRAPVVHGAGEAGPWPGPIAAGRTCAGWNGWCSAMTSARLKWSERSPTCTANAQTCSRVIRP